MNLQKVAMMTGVEEEVGRSLIDMSSSSADSLIIKPFEPLQFSLNMTDQSHTISAPSSTSTAHQAIIEQANQLAKVFFVNPVAIPGPPQMVDPQRSKFVAQHKEQGNVRHLLF